MNCPQCNAEIADGTRFCPECGAKLSKECPQCHKQLALSAKFCDNCGYNFNAAGSNSSGKLMGDRNVVSGDVINGNQDSRKYYGNVSNTTTNTTTNNTTTVINQDETKKVVTCHICGRNLTIDQAISCPECRQMTCDKCYDFTEKLCKKCVVGQKEKREEVYRQAVFHALEDGIITPQERGELLQLKNQLGLSDERAAELEKMCRSEHASGKNTTAKPLSMFEKVTLDKAKTLLWDAGSEQDAWKLIDGVYQQHKFDDEVISIRIQCAQAVLPPEQLRALLNEIQADIPAAYLASIDLALQEGKLSEAENLLATAERIWPGNYLITCRKALNFLAMADELKEDVFIQRALGLMMDAPEPTDKMDRSWKVKTMNSIASALGDEQETVTPETCKAQDLYYTVAASVFTSAKRHAEMAVAKQRAEEEARQKAAAEEMARRQAEEAARQKAAAEEMARRQAEEAIRRTAASEEAKKEHAHKKLDAFEQALGKIHDEKVYTKANFDSKKLQNAIAEYAKKVAEADVLVQVDDTVFGNAKDGCIITKDHIYVKDVGGIRDAEISAETSWGIKKGFLSKAIIMDGEPIFSYTQPATESMEKLAAALNILVKCLH